MGQIKLKSTLGSTESTGKHLKQKKSRLLSFPNWPAKLTLTISTLNLLLDPLDHLRKIMSLIWKMMTNLKTFRMETMIKNDEMRLLYYFLFILFY